MNAINLVIPGFDIDAGRKWRRITRSGIQHSLNHITAGSFEQLGKHHSKLLKFIDLKMGNGSSRCFRISFHQMHCRPTELFATRGINGRII